ncbi:tetratricopeptide repeat protein [Paraliomyxa miuraensis]|uniref:tetratricopeptide repeat protein n=1 Tax=Paraliomyxa miuraensis TaxID=376150 RepID=UPI00225A79DD|nr:tetratricopeptide repeat protein [Paraliomyxa miuraensis]MCX4245387.1 tetratricopeptide repeat protein [Paraliomyxa miuraensis]
MRPPDPIASATLARLYMTQGHWVRARAILDEVLAHAPFDGDALALRARFEPARPRLTATVEDAALCLRWQGVTDPGRVHVVVSLWGGHDAASPAVGAHPLQTVTSRPCTGAFGRHLLPQPWPRGFLVATLGTVADHGFAPLAVSEPLGWG